MTAEVLKTTRDLKDATGDLRGVADDLRDGTQLTNIIARWTLSLFGLDTKETKGIVQQIANEMTSRDCSYHDMSTCTNSQMLLGEWVLQDLQRWMAPPDPSTNHNIACNSQHERTAVWVFSENIYQEWESSGTLLWVHGKGSSVRLCSQVNISPDDSLRSGLGKEHYLVCHSAVAPYTRAYILCPGSARQSSSISSLCAKTG